jgi:penicillin-binding protein 1C
MFGHRAKNIFLSAAFAQIFFALLFLYFLDAESKIHLPDVKQFDISPRVFDTYGNILKVSLSKSDEWLIPVSLDAIGEWAKKTAVAIEDKRFYEHKGIDLRAVARALFSNVKRGRIVSGASTITSQLVRITVPRERTFYNKLVEFWTAMKLENSLSKNEILELYLNRAPFGGNVRGIEAASRVYFNKNSSALSLGESVTLISLLSAPSRLRPDRNPERARSARDARLKFLLDKNIISQENYSRAISETLPGRRFDTQNDASMAAIHSIKNAPDKFSVKSTIDPKLHSVLEREINIALASFTDDITCAGIVVENSSGKVRAYVGNARHGTSLPGAQVDCGDAPRSPGSALKPFVYAAAFEKGILSPASLLADTPLSFAGAAPRNFDLAYRGPVSARLALSASLNAPAVRVLRRVGYAAAKNTLNIFGFSNINREPSYYTDSLVLGGVEVTLVQLAAAYRALARGGSFMPLIWNEDAAGFPNDVISPAAAFMVTDILKDERRLVPLYQELFQGKKQSVAFKTGTSYGYRDAWCAGYSKKYTVGLWLGNPLGRGDQSLVGLQSAAPILLKVFRAILGDEEQEFDKPDDIYSRRVCSLSGDAPTINCPQTITDIAIRGVTKISLCSLHRKRGGEIYVNWPREIRNWLPAETPLATPERNIKIIRPRQGQVIVSQNAESERIVMSAEGDFPFYWYIDAKFAGVSNDGRAIFADVKHGAHKISALSGESSDSVNFEIRTPKELKNAGSATGEKILNR